MTRSGTAGIRWSIPHWLAFSVLLVLLLGVAAGCSSTSATPANDIPDPVFTDPVAKIAETADAASFSETLFAQYLGQDPDLGDPTKATDLYMIFYAGANQRGLALSFLDTVSYRASLAPFPAVRAIWIQGGVQHGAGWQYPTYRMTNESERWGDRADDEDPTGRGSPLGNQVTIHGVPYTDPFPVTQAQVGTIWGQYSAGYAEMARLFHARAIRVHARAFVDDATVGPTSAFWAECRHLRELVQSGQVEELLCAAKDFPDYGSLASTDWRECPPCPPLPR